jgi:hypothetical protein
MTIKDIEPGHRCLVSLIPELAQWAADLADRLEVEWDGEFRFSGWVASREVGHINLTDEYGGVWLEDASTDEDFQRKGVGTVLIVLALEVYGQVFASSSPRQHDGDTTYLSTEGAALVNSCIRKGIMKRDCLTGPSGEDER